MNRIAAVILAALFIFVASAASTQESPLDEAQCILDFWPEIPPESVIEAIALLESIRRECSPATTMFALGSNVREEPSTNTSVVGKLSFRQEVQAICGIEGDEWKDSSEWCSVTGEDVAAGYVHASLLSETQPSPPVTRPLTGNCDESGQTWRLDGGCHRTDLPSGPGICTYSQAYGHYAWQRPEPPGHEWAIRSGQIVGDERWGWIVVKDLYCRPA